MATEYKLSYTAEEINESLDKINSLEVTDGIIGENNLPASGVTAGTYGGFDTENSVYNIPSMTVDEYGRVTKASNSVLPKASAESDGYISTEDYKKLGFIPSKEGNFFYTLKIPAGSTTSQGTSRVPYMSVNVNEGATDIYPPPIIHAIGEFTNDAGDVFLIPVNWELKKFVGKNDMTGVPYVGYSLYTTLPTALSWDVNVKIYSNYNFTISM